MEIREYIDNNFQETLESIKKIIRIKTIKGERTKDAPFGENLKYALEEVLSIAASLGFKTVNLDNYIGYAEVGSGEDYIAILGHIDVVPEGDVSKWTVDPYSATIKENMLISRGAIDNKAPIISALFAIKALVETNPNFNKKVRIIFGTNEESGDEDIKYYLQRENPPKYAFTPDAKFPVIFSEKGIYTFSLKDKFTGKNTAIECLEAGTRSNVIPEKAVVILKDKSETEIEEAVKKASQKTKCTYEVIENKVEVKGKSGHASSPQKGINAIAGLYIFLDQLLDEKDSMKNFVHFIATNVGHETDGKGLGIDNKNEETGDLTISAGITRIKNGEIFVKFNVRYPASITKEELDNILEKKSHESGIIFMQENHNPPLYFSKDSILVKTLQQVYKEVTGREEEPASSGGGTYAKLMPNTVAFGPNYSGFKGNAHSFDECMDLDMLKDGMEIYAKAILELGKYL